MKRHEKLVIVGGGPVGMVAALLLKDRFESIVVLERQTKEKFLSRKGFTFPLVYTPIGIKALKKAGVHERLFENQSPYSPLAVKFKVMGRDMQILKNKDGQNANWRDNVINILFEEVSYRKNISFHFESTVDTIDFAKDVCHTRGNQKIHFDMIVGADGVNSHVRRLMSEAHPDFADEDFKQETVKEWYAYRTPLAGPDLEAEFGEGQPNSHIACNTVKKGFNRMVSVMRQPESELSVLMTAKVGTKRNGFRDFNQKSFEVSKKNVPGVVSDFDENGISGVFSHVRAPTFVLGNCVLVGDAAHGWMSAGDLLSMGTGSVLELANQLESSTSIAKALQSYDGTIGYGLRQYSKYARRRADGLTGELALFGIGNKLGLTGKHPSMHGVYEDDFDICSDMIKYENDVDHLNLVTQVLKLSLIVFVCFLLLLITRFA